MLNGYDKDIENFFRWYIEVKDILTRAENAEPNGKIYFQPYNELRYALDHFMRAIGWSREQSTVSDDKKVKLDNDIKSALKSATGHLQRAYSDILEWYFLTVKNTCVKIVAPYKIEQIVHAIPNYYSEIKPFFTQFEEYLTLYKENKSSEKNDLTDKATTDSILFNLDDFNKLAKILKTVQTAEPSLVEMKLKETDEKNKEVEIKSKENKKNTIKTIVIPIITGVIGTVLGGIIVALIT